MLPLIGHIVPDRYRDLFERHLDIPTLPEVIRRLLTLLQGDDVFLAPVIALVKNDAALSGRILQLSNSAAAGGSSCCTDVEESIRRLGTTRLRAVVIAVGAISACARLTPRFSLWAYWVSAATRANLAQEIART